MDALILKVGAVKDCRLLGAQCAVAFEAANLMQLRSIRVLLMLSAECIIANVIFRVLLLTKRRTIDYCRASDTAFSC